MLGIILLAKGQDKTVNTCHAPYRVTLSPCYLVARTLAVVWLDAAAHGVKS
jgi:hypothetical protein